MDADEAAAVVIGVDTGGTFTDVFSSDGTVVKRPSTPAMPAEAILQGLEIAGMRAGDVVGHGTTVATNAVLERKGARTVLLTTAGFEDVLAIRRQNRPSLYDLTARWPQPLVGEEGRIGITERLDYTGAVLTALDAESLDAAVETVLAADAGAVAICFLFSYVNAEHERTTAERVRARLGEDIAVSVSHEVAPQYGEYERASTTVVNAYVMPIMERYLGTLERELGQRGVRRLHVMHSNGGLVRARTAAARPIGTILSGPAAGVVGARAVASLAGHERIITFDMGGTSTDVAVVPGTIMESGTGEVASFPLLMPMLTIETVGAGGGSIARVDAGGGLHVGPQSAGADPGPAAYGRGDLATVTDANLVLGRLAPTGLLGGAMPLDMERARRAMARVASHLNSTVEEAAWAVIRLTNSNMERAVRTVTLQRGHDPRRFALFPFGGAGPLHAAELAEDLGIGTVVVPPHPGVMAALGLTVPDLQRDFFQTFLTLLSEESMPSIDGALARLEEEALAQLEREDTFGDPVVERALDLRYHGQSFDLKVPYDRSYAALVDRFTDVYTQRYGYATTGAPIEVVNVRVRAILPRRKRPNLVPQWPEPARPLPERDIWFGSHTGLGDVAPSRAAVLWRPSLSPGKEVPGPALLDQYDSTTLIPQGWTATVDDSFALILRR